MGSEMCIRDRTCEVCLLILKVMMIGISFLMAVYSSKQQYFDVKYPGESTAMKALLPFTPSLMPVNDLFSAYYLGGAGKCRCQQVSQKDSASASKCG